MGTLYTYTGIQKGPDTAGIIADVQISAMKNKRIIWSKWSADFPGSNSGVLSLMWNADTDWLGGNNATVVSGMFNTDLDDSDKAILDAIVKIRAPYV